MRFTVHMTVRKEGALGVGWPYSTMIDANNEADARKYAIEYARGFHNLETLEIRDVRSFDPDKQQ